MPGYEGTIPDPPVIVNVKDYGAYGMVFMMIILLSLMQ
jgi:hypothetical protein